MEIKITNKNPYWVYFKHDEKQKITECFINQDRFELVKSSVKCHKNDVYNREKGRIQSIKKALEILNLNKKERTEFFAQYLGRKKRDILQINITNISNTVEFLKEITLLKQKYEI